MNGAQSAPYLFVKFLYSFPQRAGERALSIAVIFCVYPF